MRSCCQIILIALSIICIQSTVDALDCSDPYIWRCDTGDQCIASEELCDGTPNCLDRSDETIKNCIQIHSTCAKIDFRCTYGACIAGSQRCDGQKDCVDGSDELDAVCQKEIWKAKLQGQCKNNYVQCRSGDCIPTEDLCDGVPNCKDASDESLEMCADYSCPYISFRCGYGGCVSGEAPCNGKVECYDASDESPVMCNKTAPAECKVPTSKRPLEIRNSITGAIISSESVIPENVPLKYSCNSGYVLTGPQKTYCMSGGKWSDSLPNCVRITTIAPPTPTPPAHANKCLIPYDKEYLIVSNAITSENVRLGIEVPVDTPLEFACQPGYVLKGINNTVCGQGGRWTQNLPGCYYFCSNKHPLSGFSTTATFELDFSEVKKTSFEPDTVAKIRCASSFQRPVYFSDAIKCTKGGWYPPKVACDMKCGEPASPLQAFSSGGTNANITEVPWHVGIYYKNEANRFENICGGTLISPRVVVSAAHCFFKGRRSRSTKEDWSLYSIAAGKYYRDYDRTEIDESAVQRRGIKDVWSDDDYEGESNGYYRDISIITLEYFLTFSDTIRPACLFLADEAQQYVPSSFPGLISAWSQLKGRGSVSTLETLHMSTVEHRTCNAQLSERSHISLKGDKFCLASFGGQAFACKGDSGSGFVVRMENNLYALWGIVSYSPTRTQECSRDNLLVMTNALVYNKHLKKARDDDLKDDVDVEAAFKRL